MSRPINPTALLAGAALTFALALTWQLADTTTLRAAGEQAARAGRAVAAPAAAGRHRQEERRVSDLSHAGHASRCIATTSRAPGCTDCHGGDAGPMRDKSLAKGIAAVRADPEAGARAADAGHLEGLGGESARGAGTRRIKESAEFIRFVNPGDLRIADASCGQCHAEEVRNVNKSMMRHGGMLWGAALYNNGSFPFKNTTFGEFYTRGGLPAIGFTDAAADRSDDQGDRHPAVPVAALPVAGDAARQHPAHLRARRHASRSRSASPIPTEEGGRPRNRLSNRGLGTLNRTDPVFIGLQKTRLLDPTLNFMGTNDVAGDYRNGGCTALPRRLRQRSLAGPLGSVREGRQPRPEPDDRRDDPEGRIGPSDLARR